MKKQEGLREGAYLKLLLWVPHGSHFRCSKVPSSWAGVKCWLRSSFKHVGSPCAGSSHAGSAPACTPMVALFLLQQLLSYGDGVSTKSGGR
jgi:hypothetical protein